MAVVGSDWCNENENVLMQRLLIYYVIIIVSSTLTNLHWIPYCILHYFMLTLYSDSALILHSDSTLFDTMVKSALTYACTYTHTHTHTHTHKHTLLNLIIPAAEQPCVTLSCKHKLALASISLQLKFLRRR